MRNTKRFVQIQVRYVRTKLTRRGDTNQRVHVRTVHINLPAVLVHKIASLNHRFFKHAVSTRICDHQTRQSLTVLFGLGSQIFQIDIAIVVGFNNDHLQAHHGRTGRVGSMSRTWNQTNIAFALPQTLVITPDRQQPCVLPLSTGVRLHRHCIVTCDLNQPVAKLIHHLLITRPLIHRSKRMNVRKTIERYRNHFRGGVQLHRARPQRNHAVS